RTLGVPDAQIFLHAAPSPTTKPAVDALGIPAVDAADDRIWASINKLSKVADGTRLFIFLSGHGLYDPKDGRLFLTQDYGVNGNLGKNLGLATYIELFLSFAFREQY